MAGKKYQIGEKTTSSPISTVKSTDPPEEAVNVPKKMNYPIDNWKVNFESWNPVFFTRSYTTEDTLKSELYIYKRYRAKVLRSPDVIKLNNGNPPPPTHI